MTNDWLRHVAEVRQNNPRMNGKDVMKVASNSYRGITKPTGTRKRKPPPPDTSKGDSLKGDNWFVAADNGGWLPAKTEQVVAIEAFLKQDETRTILVGKGYYNFVRIGEGQSDRRYAIQDRTGLHKYREFTYLREGEIKEANFGVIKRVKLRR